MTISTLVQAILEGGYTIHGAQAAELGKGDMRTSFRGHENVTGTRICSGSPWKGGQPLC